MDFKPFIIVVILSKLLSNSEAVQCNEWNRTVVWVPAKSRNHYISKEAECDWTEIKNYIVKFRFKFIDMSGKSVILFDSLRKKHFRLTDTQMFEGNDANNIHNFLFYGSWKENVFCVNFCND